jgi:glycosyltransferase involved in cell wall biosynthesis
MKIIILVLHFPPKWLAGTELASYSIAKYLGKRDNNVNVITSYDEGLPNHQYKDGFHIFRISRSDIRIFGYLIFWIKIFWNIKKIQPDIVHVQGLYMAVPAFLAKKIFKIPYIISGQGSDVYLSWSFKRIISKLGLNNSKVSLALTEHMKKEMKNISTNRVIVIPNGIDISNYNLDKFKSRKKLGINQNQKIITFIGRLEPVKGVKYLIEAINTLKDTELNLKLLIVGYGEDNQKLRLLVKNLELEDHVIFTGKISNERIPDYLAASDIFVLPSLSEGFPVVLLEAMASGLPIITTNVRGLSEIIEDGTNGFLVHPKNSNEIVDRITLILNNKKIVNMMYVENKKKAESYNWNDIVRRLEEIYF